MDRADHRSLQGRLRVVQRQRRQVGQAGGPSSPVRCAVAVRACARLVQRAVALMVARTLPPPSPLPKLASPTPKVTTRRVETDPVLLAASKLATDMERRRSLGNVWMGARLVGFGFLVGAVAVVAMAQIRLSRRVESLGSRLEALQRENAALTSAVQLRVAEAPGALVPRSERATPGLTFAEHDVTSDGAGANAPRP